MSIIILKFYIMISLFIFLIEFYRLLLKNYSLNNKKIILSGIIDVIIVYNLLDLEGINYVIVFYYCLRITAFKMKIMFICFYFKFYYRIKFFYTRKLDWYNHKIYYVSKNTNIFFLLLFMFFTAIFFYKNLISYGLFLVIFSDINFQKFMYDFDEAVFSKNSDYDIILFKSGRKKLSKYLKDLVQTQNDIIFRDHFDPNKSIVLIWKKDFKYKKKIHNQMYVNGCI